MKLLFLLVTALIISGANPPVQNSVRLFYIEKNTNANIVCYDARLCPKGNLLKDEPIDVYWIMNAEDGHREDLTWLEKIKAFGIKISAEGEDSFLMRLNACDKRPITLQQTPDGPKAQMTINGRITYLQKIYVNLKSRFLMPSVEYVELFGLDPKSGTVLSEKIQP